MESDKEDYLRVQKGREKEVEHLVVFLHVIATQNEIQSCHFFTNFQLTES